MLSVLALRRKGHTTLVDDSVVVRIDERLGAAGFLDSAILVYGEHCLVDWVLFCPCTTGCFFLLMFPFPFWKYTSFRVFCIPISVAFDEVRRNV